MSDPVLVSNVRSCSIQAMQLAHYSFSILDYCALLTSASMPHPYVNESWDEGVCDWVEGCVCVCVYTFHSQKSALVDAGLLGIEITFFQGRNIDQKKTKHGRWRSATRKLFQLSLLFFPLQSKGCEVKLVVGQHCLLRIRPPSAVTLVLIPSALLFVSLSCMRCFPCAVSLYAGLGGLEVIELNFCRRCTCPRMSADLNRILVHYCRERR